MPKLWREEMKGTLWSWATSVASKLASNFEMVTNCASESTDNCSTLRFDCCKSLLTAPIPAEWRMITAIIVCKRVCICSKRHILQASVDINVATYRLLILREWQRRYFKVAYFSLLIVAVLRVIVACRMSLTEQAPFDCRFQFMDLSVTILADRLGIQKITADRYKTAEVACLLLLIRRGSESHEVGEEIH